MKIKIYAFLLFLAMMPGMANAYTLTVEDGTATNNVAPLNFYATDVYYCRSQFVYATGLSPMKGKVITSMKFFGTSSTNGAHYDEIVVRVRIGETYSASLGSTWDTLTTNAVLLGKLTRQGNNVILHFNTGYYMSSSGPSQLLIEIENLNPGTGRFFGSSAGMFYGTSHNWYYCSLYGASGSSYPVTETPTRSYFLPKCEFTYYDPTPETPCCNWTWGSPTSDNNKWISLNGNCKNQWIVGDSTHATGNSHCLYVCGNSNLGNSYVNGHTNAFVYRLVNLEADKEYLISYDWRCNGESNYDYMRVGLALDGINNMSATNLIPGTSSTAAWSTTTLPTMVLAADGGSKLNGSSTWQHKTVKVKLPSNWNGGTYRFIVYFRSDHSTTHYPAAAIDNIRIMPIQEGGFHTDFEEANDWETWCWSNQGYPFWQNGTATAFSGSKSMYVGTDAGHGYDYVSTEAGKTFRYFPIRLKAGQYYVSYNWKGVGENNYDYMRVGLLNANLAINAASGLPTGRIDCDGGISLSGQSNWNYKYTTVTVPTDTIYYLYLYWQNDGSGGSQPPAAVDNLSITKVATTLPLQYRFDNDYWNNATNPEKNYWTLANGAQTNHWTRSANGTVVTGGRTLHITNDDNNTYSYTISAASTVLASTAVNLPTGNFRISYNWKNQGETNYDYVRAVLLPANVCVAPGLFDGYWNGGNIPTGAITVGDRNSGQSSFQTCSTTVNITSAGVYRLCFVWRNDNSGGSTPPASIDNVSITRMCHVHAVANQPAWGTVTGGGDYPEGTSITLTATPASGYYFARWYDYVANNPRTAVITKDTTFIAVFFENESSQYTVTATSNNNSWGTVTGGGSYAQGATCTLTATPASGCHFLEWQDGDTALTRVFTVTGNVTYSATFKPDATPITSLPYSTGFENTTQNIQWEPLNGNQVNRWYIGYATNHGGLKALYISNTFDSINSYDITSASSTYAYATFTLPAGNYTLSYDWKAYGESNYDYLRVAFLPANVSLPVSGWSTTSLPSGAIAADGGSKLNLSGNWTTAQHDITIPTTGNYKLIFYWHNDNSSGTQPPAAIDNISLSAAASQYTITAISNNSSWGTVSGGGTYNSGASCTLTATPASGYRFMQWQDGNTDNPRTFTVTGDATYTATFAPNATVISELPYSTSFETTALNNQWETMNGTQTNKWYIGTAAHSTGSQALYISRNNGTANTYDSSSASTVFAFATFHLNAGSYSLSYKWRSAGESNWDYLRVAMVPTTVSLTPGDNSEWSYSTVPTGAIAVDGGQHLSENGSWTQENQSFTITTTGNYRLVFYWRNDGSIGTQPPAAIDDISLSSVEMYTITANSNNNSWGTVSGGGQYTSGSSVTLTATPAAGYHFEHWQDGNTSNPRTFTVTGNATYTATFAANAPDQFTISVLSNNDDWGSVSGGGTFNANATATLTATPANHCSFIRWDDGNTNNPRTITVTTDMTYTAIFEQDSFLVSVTCNNTAWGTVSGGGRYIYGATATLTATPANGYSFANWEDGETLATRDVIVKGDTSFVAVFKANDAGIDDTPLADFLLFPNPAIHTVTLRGAESGIQKVEIIDIHGRLVDAITKSFNQAITIDVSHLSAATYFVKVVTETGTAVKKLIVQ